MTRITLDSDLRQKLLNLSQPLELCDESGRVLARVLPTIDPSLYEGLEPQISKEELQVDPYRNSEAREDEERVLFAYLRTDNASWRFFRQRIVEVLSLPSVNASWRLVVETTALPSALLPR